MCEEEVAGFKALNFYVRWTSVLTEVVIDDILNMTRTCARWKDKITPVDQNIAHNIRDKSEASIKFRASSF